MNIIIPMAGAGRRFVDEGYKIHKAALSTIDRRSGKEYPMVVCATMDLPGVEPDGNNITYIDRVFHKTDGIEEMILKQYPLASFVTAEKLTEGQACTCLLAGDKINNEDPLLIAGCDNGMIFNHEAFQRLTDECDVIVFTHKHNQSVLKNPDAYGWVQAGEDGVVTGVSVKKAMSDNPMEDFAIVATFWFRHGNDFVKAAKKMIAENDRVNGEFYVDEVVKYVIELGLDIRIFEVDRYISWGTPQDYREYMSTVKYWREFVSSSGFLARE